MKRACSVLAGLACLIAASVQPALAADVLQGTVALGGGFGGSVSFLETDDGYPAGQEERVVNGNMRLGYLFADNFEFGARFTFEQRSYEETDTNEGFDTTDFVFGPMVRVHLPLSNEVNVLLGTGMGYGFYTVDRDEGEDVDADGWMLMVEGGLEYFFNDAVAAELGVELGLRELEEDNKDYDRSFIRPFLGLSVYF